MLFGWQNCKWFLSEIVKMYSSKPSFFSKKRVESGIAFTIAQAGMIFFLCVKYNSLHMSEFLWWAAAEFAVAGYMINAIQKEKTAIQNPQADQTDSDDGV